MSYLKIRDFNKHGENPFIEKTIQNFSSRSKKLIVGDPNRIIVEEDTGEITGHVAFMNYVEVDEAKFVKMFTSELKSLFNLSSAGIRVFGYVMNILKPNQDKVIIRTKECSRYIGYSSETRVRTGVADLIKNGFLARTEYTEEYYINPMLFFNGNRVSFVRQYVKKEKNQNSLDEKELKSLEMSLTKEERQEQRLSLTKEERQEQRRRAAVLLRTTEDKLEEVIKEIKNKEIKKR
jgi:hypothetical protein